MCKYYLVLRMSACKVLFKVSKILNQNTHYLGLEPAGDEIKVISIIIFSSADFWMLLMDMLPDF